MKDRTRRPTNPGERGGIVGRLLRTLFIVGLVVGVDGYLTRNAMQGGWQMEMTPEVESHLVTLMQGGGAAEGEATQGMTLKQRLQRGLSRAGGALMRGAVNQVRVTVAGDRFEVAPGAGQVVVAALIGLASESDEPPPTCSKGRIVAAFPLARATCIAEGEDLSEWLLMTRWPGDQMVLVPLSLPERRVKDLAQAVKDKAAGGQSELPSAEVREAVKEIFTLRFSKVVKT